MKKDLYIVAVAALGALAMTACDTAGPADGSTPAPHSSASDLDQRRAAVASGKVDSAGSCADACGGQSDDGCWCDEACESYGDCCADKTSACDGCGEVMCELYCEHGFDTDEDGCEICACEDAPEVSADSCEGSCGGQAAGGCWCDSACATYGDCCEDKAAACDAPPVCEPVMCKMLCHWGWAVGPDGCEICACAPAPADSCGDERCGGQAPSGCWCDAQCDQYGDCCEDKGQWCELEPEPPTCIVSGCSGQLCVDAAEGPIASTCEWTPVYACYKQDYAACEAQAGGGCGWTANEDLQACIDGGGPGAGKGEDCTEDADCKFGLVCIGTYAYDDFAWCDDASLVTSVTVGGGVVAPGEKLMVPFEVEGLASVPVDVVLKSHTLEVEDATKLRVAMIDPPGTEVTVWEYLQYVPGGELTVPNSGDDMVNGTWKLVIDNTKSTSEAVFGGAVVYITSRYD